MKCLISLNHWKCLSDFNSKGTPIERMENHKTLFGAYEVAKQLSMELGVSQLHEI